MQKEKISIPNDYKRDIREEKYILDTYVKHLISEKHAEYERFVQRIEETPSWVCSDVPSGLEDLKSLILPCIPERYLEDCRKEVEENLKDPEFRRDCVDLYVEGMRREYDVHLDSNTLTLESMANTNTEGLLKIYREFHKEMYIAQGMFDSEFIDNFYDMIAEGNEKAAFTYYYMSLDHGYQKLSSLLSKLMLTEESHHEHLTTFRNMVSALVLMSTALGSEDKKSWNDFANSLPEDNEELWKEIISSLRYVSENRGQKKTEMRPLTDMLVGDKDELLQAIEQFLKENKESISLAYLLLALERTNHIECPSFRVFWKAISCHFGVKIGFRKGLDRYGEIKEMPGVLKEGKKTWRTAKETIDTWTEVLGNCV